MGVAPFYFHGDNGNIDGSRRTYTLIPPLLFYHSRARDRLEHDHGRRAGHRRSRTPKRSVFDVAPLFFHIHGKPETGGVRESHTHALPALSLRLRPGELALRRARLLRRVTRTSDTMLSPFYSHATTRNGATSLTAIGPVVPLWWNYRDRDLGVHAWAIAPFFYTSDSPAGHDWLTPLIGHFETYGESRTWWIFPTLTLSSDRHGWEDDFHPHRVHRPQRRRVAHGPRADLLGLREPEGPDDGRLPALLALRGHGGRLGHRRSPRTRSTCRSAWRAGPTGSSTCCRSSRTASTPTDTSGTSSSVSPATRATARARRCGRSWVPFNFGAAPRASASIAP